jgi:hypothetical protein
MSKVRNSSISRAIGKGRVPIPTEVQRASAIDQGDVIKRQSLSALYGALPATRPFPGKEKIREQVGQERLKLMRALLP